MGLASESFEALKSDKNQGVINWPLKNDSGQTEYDLWGEGIDSFVEANKGTLVNEIKNIGL
ncbi:MAG: hypothetical protein HPY53_11060 [Brevinematales bacterium]|nr:hypothetical protein [Brevinematales bacterium]